MELRARFARGLRPPCLGTAIGTVLLIAALAAQPAEAQPLTSLELSFSNPGARSLGFGGAFVALADDATAAFANPAGLVQLTRPELSAEGRHWSYRTPFTRGGRVAGEPTGRGIDTVAVPLRGESAADLAGLSFVSYVHPWKSWSLALFRHQLANFEFELEAQGLFSPGPVIAGTSRTLSQRSRIDLETVTHGVAVALRPIDGLSLGLGLMHFQPHSSIRGWDYLPDDFTVEGFFSQASFLPDRLVQRVDIRMTGGDWGLSAGFLWRPADRWSLGGAYREGWKSAVEIDVEAGPANQMFPPGFKFIEGFTFSWDFPDVFALGLAHRSRDGRWTASLEWRRIGYSSILESLPDGIRDPEDFLDDGSEIHLGGEYAFFAGTSILAVRAGVWRDPDHYFGSRSDDPSDRAEFVPGEDELHVAVGLGVAFRRLQIDAGMDLSERIDTLSLSLIYSFGG